MKSYDNTPHVMRTPAAHVATAASAVPPKRSEAEPFRSLRRRTQPHSTHPW
ncbi:MAG: hypothetical protein ACYDDS_01220 [Candidatus Sulfotelmatobacter sp.]